MNRLEQNLERGGKEEWDLKRDFEGGGGEESKRVC